MRFDSKLMRLSGLTFPLSDVPKKRGGSSLLPYGDLITLGDLSRPMCDELICLEDVCAEIILFESCRG